jgi:hypothetical protein
MSRADQDINRRALIRSGATTAAALAAGTAANIGAIALAKASPTIPIEPDPIFAAISAHHQACEIVEQCGSDLDAANTPEADAELAEIYKAEEDTRAALVNPTTIAGAIALLRYVADHQKNMDAIHGPFGRWFHRVHLNIADMLEGQVSHVI